MVLLVLKCHMALWHKWHKLMLLVTLLDRKRLRVYTLPFIVKVLTFAP